MSLQQRTKFRTSQDWNIFISSTQGITGDKLLELRSACYADIQQMRGRPLLVYCTRFLDGLPLPNSIDLGDIEGFTDLVH
jgi:hypothetical protein